MLALRAAPRNLQIPQAAQCRSLRRPHAQWLVVLLEDKAATIAGQLHFMHASRIIAVATAGEQQTSSLEQAAREVLRVDECLACPGRRGRQRERPPQTAL